MRPPKSTSMKKSIEGPEDDQRINKSGPLSSDEYQKIIAGLESQNEKLKSRISELTEQIQNNEEKSRKLKLLGEIGSEMLALKDLKSIYQYTAQNLQKYNPETIILFISVDLLKQETTLETIAGIEHSLFQKILNISGFELIGRKFKLTTWHNQYFRTGNLVEFEGGLAEFSKPEFPEIAAQIIEKIAGLNKIYTIGINKDDQLLAAVHLFTRGDKTISDGSFVEAFVKQAGIVIQKKMTELALTESELSFKSLFEKGPIGVAYHRMIYDKEGKPVDYYFLQANQSYQKLTGVDPVGKLVTQAFPNIEKDPFDWIGIYGEVAKTGREIRFQQYLQTNDRWYDCVGYQHKPDHFVAAFLEITDYKLAEKKLRESEEKFRRLSEDLPVFVCAYLPNGIISYCNESLAKNAGIESNEMIGQCIFDFLDNETKNMVKEKIGALTPDNPFEIHEQSTTNDAGIEFVEEWRNRAYFDEFGNILRYVAIGLDITERKRAEEALKSSEEWVKTVLKIAPICIGVVKERIIMLVNKQMCETTGYTEEELIGKNARILYPEQDDYEFVGREKYTQIQHHGTGMVESRWKRKNGSIINILLISTPVHSDDHSKGIIFTALDITENKKAEETLRKSEEEYRSLFENSPVGVYRTTPDGQIIKANKALINMLGYRSFEELAARNLQDEGYSPEKPRQNFLDLIEAGGELQGFESTWITRDGKSIEVSESAHVYRDKDGKIIYFEGIVEDVSERKRTEQAIKKAENYYRALIEKAPDGLALISEEGNFRFVSPRARRMFGFDSNENFDQIHPQDLTHPDDLPFVLTELGKVLSNPEYTPTIQYRFSQHDGTYRWIESTFSNKLNNPDIEAIIINFRDITDRKNSEIELLAAKERAEDHQKRLIVQNKEIELNNERLESLLRISHFATNSTQELFDFALREAINLTNSQVGGIYFYDKESGHFILNTWTDIRTKKVESSEYQIIYDIENSEYLNDALYRKMPVMMNSFDAARVIQKTTSEENTPFPKFLTIPVIVDEQIDAFIFVANKIEDYDHTDIRHLNLLMDTVWKMADRLSLIQNLTTAKEVAEGNDRLKSAFLSNMSHEIRTPLNSIIGFADLIKNSDLEPKQHIEFAQFIKDSGNNLLAMISDIMDFSKIESRQICLKKQKLSVNKIIRSLHKEFLPKAQKKGIDFLLDPLNPADELFVFSDEERIKQVLVNFIGNAIKFTEYGFVEIGFKKMQHFVQFQVKDTGIGISKDHHENIFECFRQVDTTHTRNYGGTGLGLTISKSLVELMGGSIWMESEHEKGSVFYFKIPV